MNSLVGFFFATCATVLLPFRQWMTEIGVKPQSWLGTD